MQPHAFANQLKDIMEEHISAAEQELQDRFTEDLHSSGALANQIGGLQLVIPTTVSSGTCYRYRIRVSDNVGNTSANSSKTADAKVDSSAPTAPGLTVSESSALSYVSGTTLYYNAQGTNTASFTVTGTSTDGQSGIQKLAFPAVSGMTGGGDDTTSPYSGAYTWDSSTTAGGSRRGPREPAGCQASRTRCSARRCCTASSSSACRTSKACPPSARPRTSRGSTTRASDFD